MFEQLGLYLYKPYKGFQKAEEYFIKANKLDPNNYSVWLNWGKLKIEQLKEQNDNKNYADIDQKEVLKNNAEEYLKKAVNFSKNNNKKSSCLDTIGYFYTNYKKDFKKAEECFMEASRLDPNNSSVWCNWGWCKHLQAENIDKKIKDKENEIVNIKSKIENHDHRWRADDSHNDVTDLKNKSQQLINEETQLLKEQEQLQNDAINYTLQSLNLKKTKLRILNAELINDVTLILIHSFIRN